MGFSPSSVIMARGRATETCPSPRMARLILGNRGVLRRAADRRGGGAQARCRSRARAAGTLQLAGSVTKGGSSYANAAAGSSRKQIGARGGKSPSYDDWTKKQLVERAREIGIKGRS
jgi:hypothetical protein